MELIFDFNLRISVIHGFSAAETVFFIVVTTEPCYEKTVLWSLPPGNLNRPARLLKLARVLKFWAL